jgi:hypothetical protein
VGDFGSRPDPVYAALIGDIVGSRDVRDRAGLQARMRSLLEALNGRLSAALAAPFAFTGGDEFQGLLRDPGAAVDVLVASWDALHPDRAAFGIGLGGLTVPLGGEVGSLDGPCFHRAREALDRASAQRRWCLASGLWSPAEEAVNALFRLQQEVREGWTETQRRYAREARAALRKDVAATFGVRPSVVSESLKAASFDAVLEAELAARSLLWAAAGPGA